MPNDDSTPQMLEKRNGLSSVTTVSSQASPFGSSVAWTWSGRDVARQLHVPVDGLVREQLQIPARQPFEEPPDLGLGDVRRPLREQLLQAGLILGDEVVAVLERQVVVGVDVEAPEQLLAPRRQRVRADRLDVGQRQQAQHLQPLFDADQRPRSA